MFLRREPLVCHTWVRGRGALAPGHALSGVGAPHIPEEIPLVRRWEGAGPCAQVLTALHTPLPQALCVFDDYFLSPKLLIYNLFKYPGS